MKASLNRILVVEDDPDMMILLRKAISAVLPEAEIFWAVSLEQALTKIIQNTTIDEPKPYELIVADIFLKGNGTGLDLWRVLCATYPKIPFMVISSLSEENVVAAVGESEKNNLIFLKKPFSVYECGQQINNIIVNKVTLLGGLNHVKALTEFSLLNLADKHCNMANLIILRVSADWLEKQQWLHEPYGGQNPVQDLLFQTRLAANRLWEIFFSKRKNKSDFDQKKVQEFVHQISDLTPELKSFIAERSGSMQIIFHNL